MSIFLKLLHGMDNNGLNPLRSLFCAVIQRRFQGLGHRIGQCLVVAADRAVEFLLVPGQGLFQLLAKLLHARRHAFHGRGHFGQGFGLALQSLKRLMALMVCRKMMQLVSQRTIQGAGRLQPVPAAQGRGQPQHGGGGHAGNGGAEGETQTGNRCGQCAANSAQFGTVIQGRGGAAKSHNHARKGAQQAQHHQQAGQVGCQLRAG